MSDQTSFIILKIKEAPHSWKKVKIGGISDVIGGFAFPTKYQGTSESKYLFVKVSDTNIEGNEKYVFKTNNMIDDEDVKELGVKICPEGTIIFPKIGMVIDLNKKRILGKSGTFDNNIMGIIPDEKYVDKKFMYYFFLGNFDLRRYADRTTLPYIKQTTVEKETIYLPPLVEQCGIVEVLGTVDECIRLTDEVIGRAEELKRGLMQRLLTWGIGHMEFKQTPLGKIPKTWKICKIEELLKKEKNALKTGPFGSSLKKEFYVERGYKIYGQEQVIPDDFNIGDYYISEEKFQELKDYEIKSNDILISLVGTYGRVSIVPDNIERGIINPRLLKITPEPSKINSYYLKFLLLSDIIVRQLLKYSHGATMGIINTKIIKSLTFPIPPLIEQNKIVEIITQNNNKISCEENNKEKLNLLKKGLMQLLLSGNVRVELRKDGLHRIRNDRRPDHQMA